MRNMYLMIVFSFNYVKLLNIKDQNEKLIDFRNLFTNLFIKYFYKEKFNNTLN